MINRGIVGSMGSGKSRLAHMIAAKALEAGNKVLVYDIHRHNPMTKWHPAVRFTDSLPQLLAWMECNPGALVMVEEAPRVIGSSNSRLAKEAAHLGTGLRKWNQRAYFIWQRWTDLATDFRSSIGMVYAFHQTRPDTKEMCAQIGHDHLVDTIPKQRPGSFTRLTPWAVDHGELPATYNHDLGW
jgi:ABC-type dipeptide/oligopeptide/nickel transport system ATPase component